MSKLGFLLVFVCMTIGSMSFADGANCGPDEINEYDSCIPSGQKAVTSVPWHYECIQDRLEKYNKTVFQNIDPQTINKLLADVNGPYFSMVAEVAVACLQE